MRSVNEALKALIIDKDNGKKPFVSTTGKIRQKTEITVKTLRKGEKLNFKTFINRMVNVMFKEGERRMYVYWAVCYEEN